MFSTISWGRFSTVILSLTALYYLFIALNFYRKTVIRWLKSKAGLIVSPDKHLALRTGR